MRDNALVGLVVALLVVTLAVGYGGAMVVGGANTTVTTTKATTATTTVTSAATSAPQTLVLTLVITTANTFNSTVGDQPAFYLLGPKGLESTAHLTIPVNTLIKLVIVNYDGGNGSLVSPTYSAVTGTVNSTVTVVSEDDVNSSAVSNGISVNSPAPISTMSPSILSHTFTIPSLGVNVPVALTATTTTYLKFDKTGTYLWFCMTACGSGADGLSGAMKTAGWMTGLITVV
jgi:heme/copper-type cytochrome/quinol oxidase subunit 2